MPNTPTETDEWLPIRDAATRKHISTQAIGQAIKRGVVASRGTLRRREVRWADVAALAAGRGGLLPGTKPAGASVRTDRTAQTARQNGKLGGRPKNKPAPPPDRETEPVHHDANYTGRD